MNLKYLFSKSKINSSRSYCTYRKDILNIKVSTTLSSNYDLAHSIHGVIFTLRGQSSGKNETEEE